MELMTKSEREQIEVRLTALVANRAAISLRIAEARALGDLKENGDYHAAREQQGIEEAEIRRIEQRLAQSQVIDRSRVGTVDVVFIGATVRMSEQGSDDEPELFKLVGEASGTVPSDVVEVTATSPMGEALMKARVGEIVAVRTPRGLKKFKILEIV